MIRFASFVFMMAIGFLSPSVAFAQNGVADSVYSRAQRMVSDGDATGGRAVVDSMLRMARRGSPAYAEALFWRASLAPAALQSEQDYRRLIVEYPLYARTGDVLLRLAQLELLRGNRDAALVHLRRIQSEHPEFSNQAAASYWIARTLFEKNDAVAACGAIADAKRLASPDDVELKNQIDFQEQQCAGVTAGLADTTPKADISNVPPAKKAPKEPERASHETPASPAVSSSTAAGAYSIQVAAYNRETQARALVSKLTKRGFSVRIDGSKAPFRVRIGRYRTRAEASSAQQRMRKSGISGFVVKAD